METHQALLVTLPSAPGSYLTCVLGTASINISPIDRNSVFPTTWSACVELSHSSTLRPPDGRLPGYLGPDPALTRQLALDCKRWSCASETFLISACEIDPKERRILKEGLLRPLFSSNLWLSASLQWRNILRNRNADFAPACPLA